MDTSEAVIQEKQRDAFLYIPGLGHWAGQTIDAISRQLAAEFDRHASRPEASFTVHATGHEEEYLTSSGQTVQVPVRTIVRVEGKTEQPVADVYFFDYLPILTESFRESSHFVQSLRLMVAILANSPRLFALLGRKEKTFTEKLQFFFAVFILLLLGAYMIILLVAVFQTLLQILNRPDIQFTLTWPRWITDTLSIPLHNLQIRLAPTFSQAVVILIALVQVLAPGLQEKLKNMATEFLSLIDYITLSEQKDAISGVFADFIDFIAAKGAYRMVTLVAFSFGSAIAIDNLFPSDWKPVPRTQIIDNLVTIGCPFDLLRAIWKDYFKERNLLPAVPKCWINVYSPLDILGSNFRNDDKTLEAKVTISPVHQEQGQELKVPLPKNLVYTAGINPKGVSKLAWMSLLGFRAHNMYWKARPQAEISCFYEVLGELYPGEIAVP